MLKNSFYVWLNLAKEIPIHVSLLWHFQNPKSSFITNIFLYYYYRIEYIIFDKKLPPSSSSSKISLRTSCIPPSGLESPKTSSTSTASAVPSSSSSTEPTLDLAVLRLMRALIDFYRKRNIWIKKITQPFFKVEMYSKLGTFKYFLKLIYDL